jgi:hypothetical protein
MSLQPELMEAFKKGRAAFFVGAGASIPAGLPTWTQLLQELIEIASKVPGANPEWVKEYHELAKDPSKNLVLASALKDDLAHRFSKYIESKFGNEDLEPSAIHKALVDFPAQFFVTTNYDQLIERAYSEKYAGKKSLNSYTFRQVGQAASSLFRNKPFVFHVHGDAKTEPDGIVLTEKDYRILIQHEVGLQSFLQTLFTTFTVVFIGTSMSDMDVRLMLGFIHSSFHGKTPTHYALVSDRGSTNAEVRSFFKDFNVEVVHIDHRDIAASTLKFLSDLKAAISSSAL